MEAIAPILEVANDHPYLSAASVIVGCAALMRLAQQGRSDLPPGPKGYPIVGNLFDVPSTHAWEKFSEFSEQYGVSPSPIVTCFPLWQNQTCFHELYAQAKSRTSMSWAKR